MPNLAMPTGVSLDSTTAVASDIFSGKTAYNGEGERITGTYSFPSVNVTAGNMLSGTSAINSSGSVVNGTMVNRGSPAATLSVGGSKYYSAGYYSAGTVSVNSLPATTAAASDIRSGKIALNSSGTAVTGTMTVSGLIGTLFASHSSNGMYSFRGTSDYFNGSTFTQACDITLQLYLVTEVYSYDYIAMNGSKIWGNNHDYGSRQYGKTGSLNYSVNSGTSLSVTSSGNLPGLIVCNIYLR